MSQDAVVSPADRASQSAQPPPQVHNRQNPYLAEITRHDRLTGPGSLKDTRHFVIDLGKSGIIYTPGDSLGAFGSNPPGLVDEVLEILGFEGDAAVTGPKGA